MLHRSCTNATEANCRAVFYVYNSMRDGDWHNLYYLNEVTGQRANSIKKAVVAFLLGRV